LSGSGHFNFTKSADVANQESVVVLDDKHIIAQFNKQHERLKERSINLDAFAKNHFIMKTSQPVLADTEKRISKKTSVAHAKRMHPHKDNKFTFSVVV